MTETNAMTDAATQQFWQELFEKANTDAAFRRQLETDPAAAFSTAGLELRSGVRFVCEPATPETAGVVFARSTETEIHIPIVAHAEGALPDAQLEQVSGGIDLVRDIVITDRPPIIEPSSADSFTLEPRRSLSWFDG